ncbi:conserved hypothetical protein [Pseudarthrobacter chlorophenolicus A6]|uniref:Uncharacterized protein n=1 Tax=Pseudarthrobacter chlorophenolicus (strain ATCC 700700 / DSM 12829 / CIP 107037 / JCM 12360 / KCTC 9906 / NCIMB 13794 / A6) TaxID=452863 RepID=B8HH87_PSECP|nr:hypothetical protein [Pseudarthrobacter chlorophenolicus]ACL41378.1 conserved hypothetical protein [Pseudarthrobacter chlorophenolicus A6]SDQ65206.1 hypothetical protein SAMN04489738_2058 [Pseudarthrobacter chlorophenolicus]
MTTPNDERRNTADLRGPGDPDEVRDNAEQVTEAPQSGQHPEQPHAANIREEQQAHAAGTVPASYVGSSGTDGSEAADASSGGQERTPEEAVKDPGTWDDDV